MVELRVSRQETGNFRTVSMYRKTPKFLDTQEIAVIIL